MLNHKHIQTLCLLISLFVIMLLAGCHTAPEIKTVVEYRSVAIKVPDAYYELKPVPPPPSKESLTESTSRQVNVKLGSYINDLHSYIAELRGQITGIQKASNEAAIRINKGESK